MLQQGLQHSLLPLRVSSSGESTSGMPLQQSSSKPLAAASRACCFQCQHQQALCEAPMVQSSRQMWMQAFQQKLYCHRNALQQCSVLQQGLRVSSSRESSPRSVQGLLKAPIWRQQPLQQVLL